MPQIIQEEFDRLVHLPRVCPITCVETGTFEGNFTTMAARHFRELFSIELSPKLYKAAKEKFSSPGTNLGCSIHMLWGDSRQLVPALAHSIRGAVFWYFDANWWHRPPHLDPGIAGAPDEYPLAHELVGVSDRRFGDIVVINDRSTLDTLSEAGRDRRGISLNSIIELLDPYNIIEYKEFLMFEMRWI